MTAAREVFAKFRLSIDDGHRNEFSFVHYRRWGQTELWEAGRFTGPRHVRQTAHDRIEVWRDWEMVASVTSRADARAVVAAHLADAPVPLGEMLAYLTLE